MGKVLPQSPPEGANPTDSLILDFCPQSSESPHRDAQTPSVPDE